MKINKILYKIVLLIILIVMCNSYCCFAANPNAHISTFENDGRGGGGGSGTTSGSSSTGLPSLDSSYQPSVTVPSGGKTMNIFVSILNVLTVLGVIGIVVSMALIGFNTILGSASEKAQGQEKYAGLVIAALVITGGSVLAKMIISVAESL